MKKQRVPQQREAPRKNGERVDLDELLLDVDKDELLNLYDEAAVELLQVARSDGHFADRDPDATA